MPERPVLCLSAPPPLPGCATSALTHLHIGRCWGGGRLGTPTAPEYHSRYTMGGVVFPPTK